MSAGLVGGLALVIVVWPGVRGLDLDEPQVPTEEVTTRVTENEEGRTEETTRVLKEQGWIDRTLGDPGLSLLIRVGIAAAVTFAAAGVVQRMLLGDYAFKAAGVELPARQAAEVAAQQVASDAATAIEALQAQVGHHDALLDEVVSILKALARSSEDPVEG